MQAFHNDPKIKEFYLKRVESHRLADEIIKGQYWEPDEDGKFRGCAVGCTLHSNNHKAYETELGIPITLARLEDGIFESLPTDRATMWPGEFLDAINVGADLERVWPKFAIWLLTDEKHGVFQYAKTNQHKEIIQLVADYYLNYKEITKQQWMSAIDAARESYAAAYIYAASYAAAAAAYDSASSAATYAAIYAVAYSVACTNDKKNHRIAQANKLLELLKECK